MKSTLTIIARPKSADLVRKEFDAFLARAEKENWTELNVTFGFAWGNYLYERDWLEELFNANELREKVKEAEENGDGAIGSDDLYVTPVGIGVEYTFCHEADIHLEGSQDSEFLKNEKERYQSMGWDIYETLKPKSEQDGAGNA